MIVGSPIVIKYSTLNHIDFSSPKFVSYFFNSASYFIVKMYLLLYIIKLSTIK